MDKTQLIKNYGSQIETALGNMYSNGYEAGYTESRKEVENIRGTCIRTNGEHDDEYSKKWDDDAPFYGWCSKCERPHSGRWAHMWEFCPWCGARIDHSHHIPDPAPKGHDNKTDG